MMIMIPQATMLVITFPLILAYTMAADMLVQSTKMGPDSDGDACSAPKPHIAPAAAPAALAAPTALPQQRVARAERAVRTASAARVANATAAENKVLHLVDFTMWSPNTWYLMDFSATLFPRGGTHIGTVRSYLDSYRKTPN